MHLDPARGSYRLSADEVDDHVFGDAGIPQYLGYTLSGSLRYSTSPRLESQTLLVTLASEETCRSKDIPTYHRTAHITHEAQGTWTPGYTVTLGVTGVVLGAWSYVNADSVAEKAAQDGNDTSPGDYRVAGAGLAVVGAVALAIGIVDFSRLGYTNADLGQHRGKPAIHDAACRRHVVSNTRLVAKAGGTDWATETATDASGVAQLSLHELPENAFHGSELSLLLELDGASIPVSLDSRAATTLLTALAADPASRVAIDRDTRRPRRARSRLPRRRR